LARRRAPRRRRGCDGRRGEAEAIGLRAHADVLRFGLVIPSQEVQEAVGEEHRHLVENRALVRLSLLSRGGDAHNDIAQKIAGEAREIPFAHGECEDVRGAVFSTIRFVQLLDLKITR